MTIQQASRTTPRVGLLGLASAGGVGTRDEEAQRGQQRSPSDQGRLPFLPAELRSAVRPLNGHPLVSRAGRRPCPASTSPVRPPCSRSGRRPGSSRARTRSPPCSPRRQPGALAGREPGHAGPGQPQASSLRAEASDSAALSRTDITVTGSGHGMASSGSSNAMDTSSDGSCGRSIR